MSNSNVVSVSREIAAPVETVWGMVTNLERMGEWSPENQGGSWVKGATGPSVGAEFKGRNKNGKKSWSTVVRVGEFDAPRKFSFSLVLMGKNWCDWVWELEPAAGGCRVTHSWVDHRGRTANVLGKLVSGVGDRASHNRRNMEATLERLAAAVA